MEVVVVVGLTMMIIEILVPISCRQMRWWSFSVNGRGSANRRLTRMEDDDDGIAASSTPLIASLLVMTVTDGQ